MRVLACARTCAWRACARVRAGVRARVRAGRRRCASRPPPVVRRRSRVRCRVAGGASSRSVPPDATSTLPPRPVPRPVPRSVPRSVPRRSHSGRFPRRRRSRTGCRRLRHPIHTDHRLHHIPAQRVVPRERRNTNVYPMIPTRTDRYGHSLTPRGFSNTQRVNRAVRSDAT